MFYYKLTNIIPIDGNTRDMDELVICTDTYTWLLWLHLHLLLTLVSLYLRLHFEWMTYCIVCMILAFLSFELGMFVEDMTRAAGLHFMASYKWIWWPCSVCTHRWKKTCSRFVAPTVHLHGAEIKGAFENLVSIVRLKSFFLAGRFNYQSIWIIHSALLRY